jgi:hypothetical protein
MQAFSDALPGIDAHEIFRRAMSDGQFCAALRALVVQWVAQWLTRRNLGGGT